jgi:hypothetical protein
MFGELEFPAGLGAVVLGGLVVVGLTAPFEPDISLTPTMAAAATSTSAATTVNPRPRPLFIAMCDFE